MRGTAQRLCLRDFVSRGRPSPVKVRESSERARGRAGRLWRHSTLSACRQLPPGATDGAARASRRSRESSAMKAFLIQESSLPAPSGRLCIGGTHLTVVDKYCTRVQFLGVEL